MCADRIHALISLAAAPGIYHATSSGQTTWFGLAEEVFRLGGADPAQVQPSRSSCAGPPRARGPPTACSAMPAWERAGLTPIGDWRDALRRGLPGLAVVTTATEPAS